MKEYNKILTEINLTALVSIEKDFEDKKVLVQVKNKAPMNALEKMQARKIYEDHKKLKNVHKDHRQQEEDT